MDVKTVKNLINLFENSDLGEMEVESNENGAGMRVVLKRNCAPQASYAAPAPAPAPAEPAGEKLQAETGPSDEVLDYNLVTDVKSPMVGVFYSAPSPESEPFVTRGTRVNKGDTLCIIEAMKLMNEVVAERDGEVVEVLAKSGELVEFGQVLFRIF